MHFGDSIFIFLLALVLFGPKKLPEIGRTIGKLLAEFRRASNEFKFQIQDELRNMEEDERRKKLAEAQAQKAADAAAATPSAETPAVVATAPSILPPSTGSPISKSSPYVIPGEPTPVSTTVEPSAAEVIVDPPTATVVAPQAALEPSAQPSANIDLTPHTNGAHPASTEAEAIEPSETAHHG